MTKTQAEQQKEETALGFVAILFVIGIFATAFGLWTFSGGPLLAGVFLMVMALLGSWSLTR